MNLTQLDNKPLPDHIQLDTLSEDDLTLVYLHCKLTLPQMADIEQRLIRIFRERKAA